MENQLNRILLDGEEIRWSGRPAPFKLMDLPGRGSFILTWILSGCLMLLTLGAFTLTCVYTPLTPVDFILLALAVMLLLLMAAFRPVLDRRWLLRETVYAITNYRVIAIINGDVMYVPLSRKLKTAIASRREGCGNLYFGEAVHVSPNKELASAVIGVRSIGDIANPNVPGILFYHIRHPESILRYLT